MPMLHQYHQYHQYHHQLNIIVYYCYVSKYLYVNTKNIYNVLKP